MKNALISPNEKILDPNTQEELGWRVAQVSEQTFEIAPPLFWTACADDVIANEWYYDPADQQLKQVPPYIPPVLEQPTTSGTQTL